MKNMVRISFFSQGQTPTKKVSLQKRDIKGAWLLSIGVFFVYLAFMPISLHSVDGHSMASVAVSIVTKGNFTVEPVSTETGVSTAVLGPDGNYYSVWYPFQSFLAVPFVAVGVFLENLLHLPSGEVSFFLVLLLPAMLTAATSSLVALLALRLNSSPEGAFLAGLSFAFGTIAFLYARTFYVEPLLAFLTIFSLYLALEQTTKHVIGSGIVTCLAFLSKPTALILGPILSLYLVARTRSLRLAWIPTFGSFMGIVLYLLYNYVRFQDPVNFGMKSSLNLMLAPDGMIGLLFSPGLGLLWFCPPVIAIFLSLKQHLRSHTLETLTILLIFLGYLFMYTSIQRPANVINWFGGWSWGARYLLPAIPALLALGGLLTRGWRKIFLFLTVLGTIVQLPTLVSFQYRWFQEALAQGIPFNAILWNPRYTPLTNSWGSAYRQLSAFMGGDMTAAPIRWLSIPVGGFPTWAGFVLIVLFLGTGLWMLYRVWRGWGNQEMQRTFDLQRSEV